MNSLLVRSLAIGTLLAAGCRTTQNEAPSEAKGGTVPVTAQPAPPPVLPNAPLPGPPAPAGPPPPPECPPSEVICAQNFDPVLCSAGTYADQPVAADDKLLAWGSNACTGRVKLAKAACQRQLLPSKLGLVQCVPDSSGGNCPPPPSSCTSGGKAMICMAGSYADQKLGTDTVLSATGLNDCAATAALLMVACRQNLNPTLVKDVVCQPDPTQGECPPKAAVCRDPLRAATCTARKLEGKPLENPLEAKGDTACEAKHELARQACKLGLRPSTLDEITCIFGS